MQSRRHRFTRSTSRSGNVIDIYSILYCRFCWLTQTQRSSMSASTCRWSKSNSVSLWHPQRTHLFTQCQWLLVPLSSLPDPSRPPPSLCWPLSTCDCDVIIVKQLPCFPRSPPFLSYCASESLKTKKKKDDSFTYKKKQNKPCKNVQDSYFIYIRFFFVFVNKMVGISLSLVVIPLLSVYWPIKTCFRLYTVLRLGFSLLCRTSDVCVCVRVCVCKPRDLHN